MKEIIHRAAKEKSKKVKETEADIAERDALMRELLGVDNAHLPLMYQLARTVWAFKLAYDKNLGLRGPQVWILLLLAKKEPRVGLTQSELTRLMKVDASAITRMVKTMEEDGLINRRPDPDDNRLTRVYLTDKGRQAVHGLAERANQVEQSITAKLSPDQLEQLREILTVLQATANQEYEKARREAGTVPFPTNNSDLNQTVKSDF